MTTDAVDFCPRVYLLDALSLATGIAREGPVAALAAVFHGRRWNGVIAGIGQIFSEALEGDC